MKLTHCTLTGVDAHTPLQALAELSAQYPVAEWGFLYSPNRQGAPGRYPSAALLQEAFETLPDHVRVALHICGQGVPGLLSGTDPVAQALVKQVAARNGRVQLNFNLGTGVVTLPMLLQWLDRVPALSVITQYKEVNAALADVLREHKSHAMLFDGSGGRGLSPSAWHAPLHGIACGYAGGLGPDNLEVELLKIAAVAGDRSTWVDMENKLRVPDTSGADWFDLARAQACLAIASNIA